MKEEIKVGIADYKITKAPNKIITLGLGSCVGITIIDKNTGIGGMAHIMLPDSSKFKKISKIEKFADLAIPQMIKEILHKGAKQRNLTAKLAGGASMFKFSDKGLNMDIGSRNVEAVRKQLKELGIPIEAEDVGGNKGRTMVLDLEDKTVSIRTVGEEIKLLQ